MLKDRTHSERFIDAMEKTADGGAAVADPRADEAATASAISSRDSEDGMSPSNYRVRSQQRAEK